MRLLALLITALATVSVACGSTITTESITTESITTEADEDEVTGRVEPSVEPDDAASIAADNKPEGAGPRLVFGRTISATELMEMLAQEGGRAEVVRSMVATTATTEKEAGCMLDNLSFETFVVVANVQHQAASQTSELLSALEICGLPTS